MKRGAPDHPKMRRLARRLGLPHFAAVGAMEMLWHWAARYAQDGAIGRYDDADIAEALGWTEPAEGLINALTDAGFLDHDEQHRLVLHGWSEHCEDAVHIALARARLRFADGTTPNLSRLGGDEKAKAEAFYKVAKTKSVRTACAQKRTKAHAVRTALASASASASSLPSVEKKETAEHASLRSACGAGPPRAPQPVVADADEPDPPSLTRGDPRRWASMLAREPGDHDDHAAFIADVLPQVEAEAEARGHEPGSKRFNAAVRERLWAFWRHRSKPRDAPRVVVQRETYAEREERARQDAFEAGVAALEAIQREREHKRAQRALLDARSVN